MKTNKNVSSSDKESPGSNLLHLQFPPLYYSRWTQITYPELSKWSNHHHHASCNKSHCSTCGPTNRNCTPPSPSSAAAAAAAVAAAKRNNNMELIQLLAINALEFTAPVYSFLKQSQSSEVPPPEQSSSSSSSSALEEPSSSSSSSPPASSKELLMKKSSAELLEREFIQLSGHPGSFAPAGPNSIWKKLPPAEDGSSSPPQEALMYTHLQTLSHDPFTQLVPHFISQTHYNNTNFIELEDLLTRFDPKTLNVMDIKLGTRTFLESEVSNEKPRSDLFDKLYKIDPSALTQAELESRSVTKLRYMQFRERLSSTEDLGFRVDAYKMDKEDEFFDVNFQRLKDEATIQLILRHFTQEWRAKFREKLMYVRDCLEQSEFFSTHEMIGSSVLLIRDHEQCGCWIIDLAKTYERDKRIDHRRKWKLGNHEDGVLFGIDNLIRLI